MEFSINFVTVPVKIECNGEVFDYTLHELSGKQRNEFFNYTRERHDSGKNLAQVQTKLVSLCLLRTEDKAPISQETLDEWPSRVVEALFDKAKEISGLPTGEETEEDKAKNA